MSVRRSTRIRSKASYNEDSEPESDVEDEEVSRATGVDVDDQTEQVGDMDDILESSSSEEEEDANDDDYVAPGSKKRKSTSRAQNSKRAKKGNSRSRDGSKTKTKTNRTSGSGSHTSSKAERETFLAIQNDFEPTELFRILSASADHSVEELASDWLESYNEDRTQALSEILNFLLDCAGCLTHIAEHDVVNNDSSNETIGEIQIMFQQQKIHEFHLRLSDEHSKRAKYKSLSDNFTQLMSNLIDLAVEKEMIYVEKEKEDSEEVIVETHPLIIDLLTWLPSLTVSKIRSLRYVSTKALLVFQTVFAKVSASLETDSLFKLRKQLTLENKKRNPKSKTIETLESSIADAEATKTIIENNMDNIIKLCFVHRFKDVDELIRINSISELEQWMVNNPEYFFKVTFLKYFGWLLSDSSHAVRLQVLKILSELIRFTNKRNKSVTDNAALRQFFERFKGRLLEIAHRDIDIQVRLTAVRVLSQINDFGYLDDEEIIEITSLIFYDQEVKLTSSSRDVKFLSEVAKFFSSIVTEKSAELSRDYESNYTNIPLIMTKDHFIEIGVLMRVLNSSLSQFLSTVENEDQLEEGSSKKIKLLYQASEFLSPKFGDLVGDIAKLLYKEIDFEKDLEDKSEYSSADLSDIKLLLPDNDNKVLFYLTVFSGLCTGGVFHNKGQERQMVAQLALPELIHLFKKMNLDSDLIYTLLLDIVCLFNSEEWSSTEQNNDINIINEIILKRFESSPLLLESQNIVSKAYKKLIPYLTTINRTEIVDSWKSLQVNIMLSLNKFLESFDIKLENAVTTLHVQYLNKLVILGKEIPTEISESTLSMLTEKFLSKLPNLLESLSKDELSILDFKIFTSVISWNLESWANIIKNSEQPVPVSQSTLSQIKQILDLLFDIALEVNNNEEVRDIVKYHVLYSVLSVLLDSIMAFKMFELNIPERDTNWKRALRQDYHISLTRELSEICLSVFLYLESCHANMLKVTLDRVDDENVNYNDSVLLDSSKDTERELCIFTMKLKGVSKLGVLPYTNLQSRLELNKDKLGSLFESIITESIFNNDNKNQPQKNTLPKPSEHERAHSSAPEEQLEPIEEFTQDESINSQSHILPSADPIVSSPI
ncbi:cohesin subunit SCC3 [Kluyveromyces marxianus DMKU3-1042]|uniref:Cohesin subunit SCC3 n=1 Tax=Kluyveromyces marxianus (strain DMKU3-1042 / BCC 29191 / NBRC 104275) TaxID=1003335 RepID=W0TE53_KLUMD|nr:cohesin subunit SCC3 [Kluyveromyces marxianus DMKU3-1042]BAO40374.1 cohesin subunit SCC3 [Kluyveromyces marxianus DMKU3-1042]